MMPIPPISYQNQSCVRLGQEMQLNFPPKWQLTAIAMAIADSVTVSMGEEIRGVFSVIFLVSADVRSLEKEGQNQIGSCESFPQVAVSCFDHWGAREHLNIESLSPPIPSKSISVYSPCSHNSLHLTSLSPHNSRVGGNYIPFTWETSL